MTNIWHMPEELHSIRFKTADAEFELRSTAEEVAKARAFLEDAVLAALSGSGTSDVIPETDGTGQAAAQGDAVKRTAKRRPTRRRSTTRQTDGGERAEIRETLLAAPVEDFPDIGAKPNALYAGYAV